MRFKNEISRRFHNWCKALIDRGEVTPRQLTDLIGKYQNNPSNFLQNIKNGTIGVSVEWITVCQERFGLNPCALFDAMPTGNNVIGDGHVSADDGEPYGKLPATPTRSGSVKIGTALHDLLQKHRIEINHYATTQLGISRQQLHNYLNGSSRLPFDIVQRICEDLGEPIDQFRSKPLPEGHMLDRLHYLQEQIKEKDRMIDELRGKPIDKA